MSDDTAAAIAAIAARLEELCEGNPEVEAAAMREWRRCCAISMPKNGLDS